MFRVRPQVRVERVQLVRRASAHRFAHDGFVRIEHGELLQELFRLPQSFPLPKDDTAANRPCHGFYELNDRLMRQAHRIFQRVCAMHGDTAKTRTAYQDFLSMWKDSDPDVPVM
jgi:hypothetical protein